MGTQSKQHLKRKKVIRISSSEKHRPVNKLLTYKLLKESYKSVHKWSNHIQHSRIFYLLISIQFFLFNIYDRIDINTQIKFFALLCNNSERPRKSTIFNYHLFTQNCEVDYSRKLLDIESSFHMISEKFKSNRGENLQHSQE